MHVPVLTRNRIGGLVKQFGAFAGGAWADTFFDMPRSEVDRYRREAWFASYEYARRWVPNYSDYPAAVPESPRALPVLTKLQVRNDPEAFLSRRRLDRLLATGHSTSGTTGTPLRLSATIPERLALEAILGSWYRRLVGTRSPRMLVLSGFLPGSMFRGDGLFELGAGSRVLFLNIYQLRRRHADHIAARVKEFRPEIVYGYASAIGELARLIRPKSGAQRLCPRAVTVTTSDGLDSDLRCEIVQSLSPRVRELYGSQEGAHLALECEEESLHLHPAVGLLETASTEDSALGEVRVSSLLRRSMPLLNYELGDSLLPVADECSCQLSWPIVGSVVGRSDDLIRREDGSRVALLGFHSFKDAPGLVSGQLQQLAYRHFRVLAVVPGGGARAREEVAAHVQEQLSNRLEIPVSVEVRLVDQIPKDPRGKIRAAVVLMD